MRWSVENYVQITFTLFATKTQAYEETEVLWDVTPCRLATVTDVSKYRGAFIFRHFVAWTP
jgi:hypothetical protein